MFIRVVVQTRTKSATVHYQNGRNTAFILRKPKVQLSEDVRKVLLEQLRFVWDDSVTFYALILHTNLWR